MFMCRRHMKCGIWCNIQYIANHHASICRVTNFISHLLIQSIYLYLSINNSSFYHRVSSYTCILRWIYCVCYTDIYVEVIDEKIILWEILFQRTSRHIFLNCMPSFGKIKLRRMNWVKKIERILCYFLQIILNCRKFKIYS